MDNTTLNTNKHKKHGGSQEIHTTLDTESQVDSGKIDFVLTTDQMEFFIEKHQDFYDGVNSFDFNIFEFERSVGRNMQMPFLATSLLKQNNLLQHVDHHKFLQFFGQVYNKYDQNVAYHNDLHGSDVAQHCNVLLKSQNMTQYAQFNNLDTLSLLIAAFCHDVQHDGFNNKYHMVTESMIYQMFGESAIQENNHAAQTLILLDNVDYDFLSGHFKPAEIHVIKKRIVESILFTDMASMNELRQEFQQHLEKFQIYDGKNQEKLIDRSSNISEEKSKQLMTNVMLHACDISTSLRDFDTGIQWASLLFEEFFHQGDVEKLKGLQVSPMCDRYTTEIAGGQGGFISFVVMPIFKQLRNVCPEISLQIKNGERNIEKWKLKAESVEKDRCILKPNLEASLKKSQNRSHNSSSDDQMPCV